MATAVCDVCGREGAFEPGVLAAPQGDGPLIVGQCALCLRFICARHAELLPQAKLGCPFDPGLPLGEIPTEEPPPNSTPEAAHAPRNE